MRKKVTIIGLISFVVDFFSKMIIINFCHLGDSYKVISRFLYITYVKNTGAAFSILNGNRILIMLITIFIMFFLIRYVKNNDINYIESIGYGLVFGGAIGNLFDRFIYGYVIDFIEVYICGYKYPVFNVADTCIVIGVFLIIINSFIGSDNSGNKSKRKQKDR